MRKLDAIYIQTYQADQSDHVPLHLVDGCMFVCDQFMDKNKTLKRKLYICVSFTIDQTEGDGAKICVSLCVAFDPKVTDGACRGFSSRKPFTQEASLTGFVVMSRSTKRRSHYHSLIVTWLGQISFLFSIQIVHLIHKVQ